MLLAALPLLLLSVSTAYGAAWNEEQEMIKNDKRISRVPVILGVMSQCPDALLCESVFDEVVKSAGKRIDISLTFIGKLDSSEPDFGVTCLHGPGECAGNVQQLCTFKYAPRSTWWRFVQCQNAQGRFNVGRPVVALKCAEDVGLDWKLSGVGECAGLDGSGKGKEGVELLQESVTVSKEIGIQKSCTILINGENVCVHDGTWKDCEGGHRPKDFIKRINKEFDRLNHRMK